MAKRLVVCCDGTWNTPDEVDPDGNTAPTNVTKMALAVRAADGAGVEQRVYYRKGVGTGTLDHWRGGALGWGLSRNVQDAYMFLVENYDPPDDEIFLFGFSRGAYTARSVAGLVRNAGLLRRAYVGKLDQAYELYRDRTDSTSPSSVEAELFRKSFAREVRIKFIGVWDTVGALGIPTDGLGVHLVNDRFKFHDVRLSSYVDNAFHALAIDERRKPFEPTIWERQPHAVDQRLEQVWFAGVHSNVGGGYAEHGLSDVTLVWMADKARECGLALELGDARIALAPNTGGVVANSMTWYYRLFGELVRPMGARRVGADGAVLDTCESVAETAVARLRADAAYRPDNLRTFLAAGGKVARVLQD